MKNKLLDKGRNSSQGPSLEEIYEAIYPLNLSVDDEQEIDAELGVALQNHFMRMGQTVRRMEQKLRRAPLRTAKSVEAEMSGFHLNLLRVADRLLHQDTIELFRFQAIRLAAIVMGKQGHDGGVKEIFSKFDGYINAETQRLAGHPEDGEEMNEEETADITERVLAALDEESGSADERYTAFRKRIAAAFLQAAGSLPLSFSRQPDGLYQRAVEELLALAEDEGTGSYLHVIAHCANLDEREFPSLRTIIGDSYSDFLLKYQDDGLPPITDPSFDNVWEYFVSLMGLGGNIIMLFSDVPFLVESAACAIRHHYETLKSADYGRALESLEEMEVAFKKRPETDGNKTRQLLSLIDDLYGEDRPTRSADQLAAWKREGRLDMWEPTGPEN